MEEENQQVITLLKDIRDILQRIDLCFEDQYLEKQKQKNAEKFSKFESILNDSRKKIFPMLFDNKHLSQSEIARIVGVDKSTVSRFIKDLLENDLIEQNKTDDKVYYRDKYGFSRMK